MSVMCRNCGARGGHYTRDCPRAPPGRNAAASSHYVPLVTKVDPAWSSRRRDLDDPSYAEWLREPHALVERVLKHLRSSFAWDGGGFELTGAEKELMLAGRLHGPYCHGTPGWKPSARGARGGWLPRAGGKVSFNGKCVCFEDEQGTMRMINPHNFFTAQTPEDNRLKHVTNAVRDSCLWKQWKARPDGPAISLAQVAQRVIQRFPDVECRRNGPRKDFVMPEVYDFIASVLAGEGQNTATSMVEEVAPPQREEGANAGVARVPESWDEISEESAVPSTVTSASTAIPISVLRFHRNPAAFRDALLESSLAQEAAALGVDVEPSWANGAKVFVPAGRSELPDDLVLRPYHVIVATDDVPRVEEVLASLPCKERPLLKGSPRELKMGRSPRSSQPERGYVVERTFIHTPIARAITPRSAYTRSSNDRQKEHVNPRVWSRPCVGSSPGESAGTAQPLQRLTLRERVEEMKDCQKRRDMPGAIQCYSGIRRDELEPDVQVFSMLIDICGKAGDHEEAERWLQRMRTRGIEPDLITLNCLINSCANAGMGKQAEGYLKRMADLSMKPTLTSYNGVIKAYAREGDTAKATSWFEEAKRVHGRLNMHSFAPLLSNFGRRGLPREAEACYAEMARAGVPRDRGSLTHVIEAYANAQDLAGAKRWCDELDALHTYEYTLLLRACGRQSRPDEAAAIFRGMVEQGTQPDHFNLDALAAAVGPERRQGLCEELGVDVAAARREWEATRDELGGRVPKPFNTDSAGCFKRHAFESEEYTTDHAHRNWSGGSRAPGSES